jgi:hypothetical protein
MNKVVDLADVKLKRESEAIHGYAKFVEETIQLNENLIAEAIIRLNGIYASTYIVDTYACQLLGSTLDKMCKSKEDLLEMISLGGIFEAKSVLFDELMDNPVIIAAINENQTTNLGGN